MFTVWQLPPDSWILISIQFQWKSFVFIRSVRHRIGKVVASRSLCSAQNFELTSFIWMYFAVSYMIFWFRLNVYTRFYKATAFSCFLGSMCEFCRYKRNEYYTKYTIAIVVWWALARTLVLPYVTTRVYGYARFIRFGWLIYVPYCYHKR